MGLKTKWVIVIIIVIVLLAIMVIKFFGIGIGSRCGDYNFMSAYREDCTCIGIKTGGCPAGASCDKAMIKCFGIRTDCFKINIQDKTKEVISCEN